MNIRYSPYLIFSGIVLVGLGFFVLVSQGYYPVLVVDGEIVSARTFRKDYQAATIYYRNVLQMYASSTEALGDLKPEDIELSVLEQLIENNLVSKEVRHQLGSDLEALMQSKIERFGADTDLVQGVRQLYGLNFEDFRNRVLIPQAEREILSGRLFLSGKKIDDWLSEAKQKANVVTFSGQFRWSGGKMESAK